MSSAIVVEREIGGRTLRIETGRIARQAAAAVYVTYGDSAVLVAIAEQPVRPGWDFFPLLVDYRERGAAMGAIWGGRFMKREGRPTEKEILTMRMIDRIDLFDPAGGPHGLGYIRGSTSVNPEAWFFNAHFYQDPVWPGSLGLESFIQLLKVAGWHRFGPGLKTKSGIAEPADPFLPRQAPLGSSFGLMRLGTLEQKHSWVYRGQVIPEDDRVTVEAVVKQVDQDHRTMLADGFLSVDGRLIYQMTDFAITISGH